LQQAPTFYREAALDEVWITGIGCSLFKLLASTFKLEIPIPGSKNRGSEEYLPNEKMEAL
jgi:hypothetical protein